MSIFPIHKQEKDTGNFFYFTRVIVAPAFLGRQISRSQNKLFFSSCTIYYFLLEGHTVHFIPPCGAKKSIFPIAK